MICASPHFFTEAYRSLRIVLFICNLINSGGFFENLSSVTLWLCVNKKWVLYALKIPILAFVSLLIYNVCVGPDVAEAVSHQAVTALVQSQRSPMWICNFHSDSETGFCPFLLLSVYFHQCSTLVFISYQCYVIFTISLLCSFTNWQFLEIIYFKRHLAFTAKNHWQYCDFCGQLIVPEQNTELHFGLFMFCKCCMKFCIQHWSRGSLIAGVQKPWDSEFQPLVKVHFNTILLNACDWFQQIGMGPLGLWVSFPHSPAIMQIAVSSVLLSLSVSEFDGFHAWWNEISFNDSVCFMLPKVCMFC